MFKNYQSKILESTNALGLELKLEGFFREIRGMEIINLGYCFHPEKKIEGAAPNIEAHYSCLIIYRNQ